MMMLSDVGELMCVVMICNDGLLSVVVRIGRLLVGVRLIVFVCCVLNSGVVFWKLV